MDPGHTEGGIGASWAQQVREVEEGVESIDGAGALGNDGDMADAEVFEQGRDEPQPGLNTVLCVVDGSSAAEAWAVESDEPDPVLFCEFILGDVEVATREERSTKEDDVVAVRPVWMMKAKIAVCNCGRAGVGGVWRHLECLLKARVVEEGGCRGFWLRSGHI